MGYIQLRLPKRMKKKIENSRRNREARENHEEWLQSQGLDSYTLKKSGKKPVKFKLKNEFKRTSKTLKKNKKVPKYRKV